MMKLKTTVSLLALAGLMGCSALAPDAHEQPVARFGPAPVLAPQLSVSESMYAMARMAHEQGQLATAAQRYRRTLDMKPDHVGALNGLGVILAQDGRTGEALDLLARARDLSPMAGYIHNNLGYTLLREQRLDEAQVALRMARELQPDSQQTLRNLALLDRARAGQPAAGQAGTLPSASPVVSGETAGTPQIVAVAPRVYELRLSGSLSALSQSSAALLAETPPPGQAVPAVQAEVGPAPAAQEALPQAPQVAPTPMARIVPTGEPGVMALQMATDLASTRMTHEALTAAEVSPMVDANRSGAPLPAVEVARVDRLPETGLGYQLVLSRELSLQQGPFAIWTDIRGVKLEIANGVGVERLARRTADRLAQEGVATARLTNARPFRQQQTQIEYAPGQEVAVQALAARLPVPVELVPVAKLERDISLRLVLGQDTVGRTLAGWLDGDAPQLAVDTAGTQRAG